MRFSLLFLIILFFSQCTTTPDPIVVVSIENEYQIEPWLKLDPNGVTYQIKVTSLIESDCENAFIDAVLTESDQNTNLNVEGIESPDPCMGGNIIPFIDLDMEMRPMGPYNFEITVESEEPVSAVINYEDLGLFITDFEDQDNLIMDQSYIYRIPEGVAWGYLDYEASENVDLSIVESVLLVDVESPFLLYNLEGDYYGYYSLNGQEVSRVLNATDRSDKYIFNGKDPVRWAELETALQQLLSKFPSVKYEFTRWDGSVLSN